jgi:hypothetical protein
VLDKYDLPDLVASLAPRQVWLVNLRSAPGTPVLLREARTEYEYAGATYAAVNANDKLKFGLRREADGIEALLPATAPAAHPGRAPGRNPR